MFCLRRKHHWLRDLHLSEGGPRALRLSGFGVACLGLGRLYCSLGLPLLRWTRCYNPQIWRRLLLRDGNIWWFDGVSKEPCLCYHKPNNECCNNVVVDNTGHGILRHFFCINKNNYMVRFRFIFWSYFCIVIHSPFYCCSIGNSVGNTSSLLVSLCFAAAWLRSISVSRFLLLWSAVLIMYPTTLAVIALTFSSYILQPVFPGCTPPYVVTRMLSAACLRKNLFVFIIQCKS